jgi:hypothetical protein
MAHVTKLFEVLFSDSEGRAHEFTLDEDELRSLIIACCDALCVTPPVEDPYKETA